MTFNVSSSMIKNYSYNCRSKILTVTFKNGGQYNYFNVKPRDVKTTFFAPSIGQAFHKNIRNSYEYKKVSN